MVKRVRMKKRMTVGLRLTMTCFLSLRCPLIAPNNTSNQRPSKRRQWSSWTVWVMPSFSSTICSAHTKPFPFQQFDTMSKDFEQNSTSSLTFCAIRKAPRLEAPVIFLSKKDAETILFQSDDALKVSSDVEFRIFQRVQDALSYVLEDDSINTTTTTAAAAAAATTTKPAATATISRQTRALDSSKANNCGRPTKRAKRASAPVRPLAWTLGNDNGESLESKRGSRVDKKQLNFQKNFDKWREYKDQNPDKEPKVGTTEHAWVSRMRRAYRAYIKGEKEAQGYIITPEQVKTLTDSGFRWETNYTGPKAESNDRAFNENYFRWCEYKARNPDGKDPPHRTKENDWAHRMRLAYASFTSGKQGNYKITQEQIDKLNMVGFVWNSKLASRTRTNKTFDERLEELKAYKEKHGDCLVPKRYPGGLGTFISSQRKAYANWKVEGKTSYMNEEKYQKLVDIGFSFQVRERIRTFDEQLDQLRAYKVEHGNVLVPSRYPNLGPFVKHHRKAFRLWKEGKKSVMTEEKYEKLLALGFDFGCQRGAPHTLETTRRRKAGSNPELGGDSSADSDENDDRR